MTLNDIALWLFLCSDHTHTHKHSAFKSPLVHMVIWHSHWRKMCVNESHIWMRYFWSKYSHTISWLTLQQWEDMASATAAPLCILCCLYLSIQNHVSSSPLPLCAPVVTAQFSYSMAFDLHSGWWILEVIRIRVCREHLYLLSSSPLGKTTVRKTGCVTNAKGDTLRDTQPAWIRHFNWMMD